MRNLTYTLLFIFLMSCSTTYQNQQLIGKKFPSIEGQSLEKITVKVPEEFAGKPVVLLLGYDMDSQFDIDRWLIGLDMTETSVAVYELPTIAGLFPRMFSTTIDNGMRKGIPKEIWKGVITVYEDGERVQEFTGNVNPRNTRALLLDKDGVIQYFHDRGFSVLALNELREKLEKL